MKDWDLVKKSNRKSTNERKLEQDLTLPRNHIRIIPITSKEFYEAVLEAAELGDDGISNPTHAVMRKGEIVGAFSTHIPCATWWMSTSKEDGITSIESMMVLTTMEAMLRDKGVNQYLIPCNIGSPYYSLMGRIGYEKQPDNLHLFSKNIAEN